MTQELIVSVAQIVPSKGTNAGKQMYFINGKHWSKTEPQQQHTHVVLEEVVSTKDPSQKYINVIGFAQDTRMSIADKIGILKANDPALALAIAALLK